MTVDRRSFFKGGIMATLFAGIPGSVSLLAAQVQKKSTRVAQVRIYRPKSLDSLARLSMASFSPFVDTPFTVRSTTSTFTMTMTQVSDLRKTSGEIALAREGREFFSIEFSGSTPLPQGMYEFRNDSLGAFSMMIVPGQGSTSVATINRLYS